MEQQKAHKKDCVEEHEKQMKEAFASQVCLFEGIFLE